MDWKNKAGVAHKKQNKKTGKKPVTKRFFREKKPLENWVQKKKRANNNDHFKCRQICWL